jgi:phage gpG-like protein
VSKPINDLAVEYKEEEKLFLISVNNTDEYTMSPSQFYQYVNNSIGLMNKVVMTMFNKSLYEFMNASSDFDKFRFKEGDGALIAEDLSEWLKSHSKEGDKNGKIQ